ncbi:MAG TPA: NAD-dependent epimerase/dehydratase family protein [Gaiellaceae bacterium]|nr:NAD-dependent epimerase/dehydratase family protein [Gaiellaceae bacterium]
MKAFVTGATGFVGGRLAARLRERGDDVVALVRSPERAAALRELGCELVEGDLSSRETLERAAAGCDAAFHLAAIYESGIPARRRDEVVAVNVTGTENVLDAAAAAGVARIVHVSSNVVAGNTRGRVVDESWESPAGEFVSLYHETKALARRAALDRIARGAPILVAQPGGIYGPGDHTEAGGFLARAARGRVVLLPFGSVGLTWVHVDDVVEGILLVHDRGRVGETYSLGGEMATLRTAVEKAFAAGGRRPRVVPVPTWAVRLATPLGPLLGVSVSDYVSAADGVTYWVSDEKARRELGYAPRGLDEGLRAAFSSYP